MTITVTAYWFCKKNKYLWEKRDELIKDVTIWIEFKAFQNLVDRQE
jgi:hypothetical protein